MGNPLVAGVKDSTQSYSGVSLLESAHDLKSAIDSGDWASVAMGTVGTALDALSMAMDPFGAILAAGVGWLMEHVGPLKEALNALAGNPDQISANSETWKNIATELGSVGQDLGTMSTNDTASWTGVAADAYRQRASDLVALLNSAQEGCAGASSGVKTAGEVVAAVRSLVRDIIAELVGHMISWALQVVFTLGIGLTWVVPQVVTAVAKTASEIADITSRLVKALKALVPLLKKAGDLFGDAAKALRKIKPGKGAPSNALPDLPKGPKGGGAQTGGKGAGDGSTAPSSTPPPPKDTPPPPKSEPNGSTTASSSGGSGSGSGSGSGGSPGSGAGDAPPPPKSGGSPDGGGGSTTASADAPSATGGGTPKDGSGSPNKPEPARDGAVGTDNRFCASDPIDVATGEMVLTQVDLALPGLLELMLERTHISSYRAGHWFGPSWTSTVDQRLEVDAEDVCYFSADGMILVYPLPIGDAPVLPLEGPRFPLTLTEDGYRLDDPIRQLSMVFSAVPGRRQGLLPLVAVEHESGQRIDVDHAVSGAPSMLRHSDGYWVRLHTGVNRVTGIEVLDPDDRLAVQVVRFGYDPLGQLTQVANSSGKPMTFDYDSYGRIVGWQDRNGTWYRYVYDADGRCLRTVGEKGFLDGAFAYDRERRVTRYTNSVGQVTEYHLNEANQLLREVGPLGQAVGYEWDRYDRLLSRTDPLGRVTSYGYDEDGRLVSVTRPDGSAVRIDQGDDALSITVDDGDRIWRRTYEGDGIPDPDTEQLGVSTPMRYDTVNGSAASAPGGTAAPGASEAERPAEDRDLFGRVRSVLNRSRQREKLGWTVEGQQSVRIRPSGAQEQWRHDPEGNELEHVNAAGLASRNEYGPFNLLTASYDQSGARTTYTYDTELRLIAVGNPGGLRWTYTYDPAGRLVEECDFDGRVLRFGYDDADQLLWSANGIGEVTEFSYDALGNVVERRSPAGITRYTYDPVGRLTLATSADAELRIERDDQGRVVAESVNGRALTFGYSSDGRTVRRRTPSGADSEWTYDAAGNPLELTTAGHSVRFAHDAAGREISRSVDDVLVLSQSFDIDDNLRAQSVTAAGAAPQVVQRTFDYRADGYLTGVRNADSAPVRLVLDPAGRVTEVHTPEWRENYRYDGSGNVAEAVEQFPVAKPPHPLLGARRYSGNTLAAAGGVAFGYDRQGRMVSRREPDQRVWNYTWDSHDRLIAVTAPDGSRWAYRYDPLGRRIAKQRLVPSATGVPVIAEQVEFTWSGGVLVEQVHTDATGTTRTTTWEHHPGDDRPILQIERAGAAQSAVDHEFYAIVTGLLGTPTELVDTRGTVVWQGKSSLWGKPMPAAPGAVTTPLRFPGQYADAETGLHYNVYRYYDPALGRYLSQDPLGLGPAPNPVSYVENPYTMSDALGLAKSTPCTDTSKGKGNGGKGNKPNRPGGGNDAGNLPGSSTKPAGNAPTKHVGTYDGVDVEVDSHQGKHQANGNIYPGEVAKYSGGSGTKFPSNVSETWHEKYFAPEVAKHTKAEVARLEGLQKNADDLKVKAEDSGKKADLAEAKANNAKQWADDGNRTGSPDTSARSQEADRMRAEADRARRDADNQSAAANQAAKTVKDENVGAKLNGDAKFEPSKETRPDGVKYDITAQYNPQTGKYEASYHGNPDTSKADEKAEKQPGASWWNDYGKKIQKGQPGLPDRTGHTG
jgi:RHS repeat-associated protein